MRKSVWIGLALLAAGCSRAYLPAPGPAADAGAIQTADDTSAADPAAPEPLAPAVSETVIPSGTRIDVRLDEPLNTRRNRRGDYFWATLESPVIVNGATVIPAGTRFMGHVTASRRSERSDNADLLAIDLDSFSLGTRSYHVHTAAFVRGGDAGERHIASFVPGHGVIVAAVEALRGEGRPAAAGESRTPPPDSPDSEVGLSANSLVSFSLAEAFRM